LDFYDIITGAAMLLRSSLIHHPLRVYPIRTTLYSSLSLSVLTYSVVSYARTAPVLHHSLLYVTQPSPYLPVRYEVFRIVHLRLAGADAPNALPYGVCLGRRPLSE